MQTRDTLVNLGGDQSVANTSLLTANGTSVPFYSGLGGLIGGLPTLKNYTVPDAMLLPGDFQITLLGARSQSGNAFRLVASMEHFLTGRYHHLWAGALHAGCRRASPQLPTSALQAELPTQSAYNTAATAQFQQSDNSFDITSTAAYNGALPANWLLAVPDLTAAAYNVAWGLRQGVAVD